jgi:hypothetical protein
MNRWTVIALSPPVSASVIPPILTIRAILTIIIDGALMNLILKIARDKIVVVMHRIDQERRTHSCQRDHF